MELDFLKIAEAGELLSLDDYRVEAMLALDASFAGEGLAIPQPTPGCLPLFEALDSPFLSASREYSAQDMALAATLLCLREKAVGLVLDAILSKSQEGLLERAWTYLAAQGATKEQVLASAPVLRKYASYIYNGFGMLPESGAQEPKKMRFDSEWIARLCVRLHAATGARPFEILWRMPLTFAGFATAIIVDDDGKTIARPRNWDAIGEETRRQMEKKGDANV